MKAGCYRGCEPSSSTPVLTIRQKAVFKHHQIEDGHNDGAYIDAAVFDDISAKEILQLVRELPATTRMVFNLFAIEGYTHEQISKLLQIPAGTSRWYASEARKLLREKMEKQFSTAQNLTK